MYKHSLAYDNSRDLISIRAADTVEKLNSHPHPYTFHTAHEVPSTLSEAYFILCWRLQVRLLRNDVWSVLKGPIHLPNVQPGRHAEEGDVTEISENDRGAAVDTCGFTATSYKGTDN